MLANELVRYERKKREDFDLFKIESSLLELKLFQLVSITVAK